jgi:hypothetical protein
MKAMQFTCNFDGMRFVTMAATPSKARANLAFRIARDLGVPRTRALRELRLNPVNEKTPSHVANGAFLTGDFEHQQNKLTNQEEMSETNTKSGPDYIVYAEKEVSRGKTRLFQLGAAFKHQQGEGLNVILDSMPIGGLNSIEGRFVLFPPRNRQDAKPGQAAGGSTDSDDDIAF